MSEKWSIMPLGATAKIYNGNSINAEEKKKMFLGQQKGLPFIATKDVGNDGIIDYENGVKIPDYTSFKVAYPDSVFVCAEGGSAGKKVAYIEQEVCFGNKLFAIQPISTIINGKYLYYYVQSNDFRVLFKSLITGIIGGVSVAKFKEIPINYPSLSEQQRIVDILDMEFAKIDSLKANAELNLLNAKYLFQAALKKELEPKEGWSHRLLKDICEGVSYGTSLPSVAGGKYKYLRMGNITSDGELVLNNIKFIDVPESEKEKCIVRKGDILFNRTNSRELVGKTCLFDEDEDMVIAGYIIRVRVKSEVLPKFVVYHLNKPETKAYLRTIATGAVHQSNINATNLQSVEIDFPNVEEQALIVSKIDIIKQQAIRLQDNYTKTIALCDDLKQSLLRKAFNGELL